MVDFKKVLKGGSVDKKINPIEIYESLDRASDKGPLRPVQKEILEKWIDSYHDKKDVILKLHTGQGKTLIGLLILQSKLNEHTEPVLYLCPNNHLVQQTTEQATQFGLKVVNSDGDLPQEFLDGKSILITTVQKLFNGFSKFGLDSSFVHVNTIIIDDAHACMEIIRDAFIVRIENTEPLFESLFNLFSDDIKEQGTGTFYEIHDKEFEASLPVPYWSWNKKNDEVYKLVSNERTKNFIKYKWPLIKDRLKECHCIISGTYIEISPMVIPINMFPTYENAKHRLFMSATINDDSFLIRNLGVNTHAIKKPLMLEEEKWSGEKMILIPSLIHSDMERDGVVSFLGKPPSKPRRYGTVALVPSYRIAEQWESYGTVIIKTDNISAELETLRNEDSKYPVVLVNRYDGIDLPDKMCRILIIDSKPYFQTLIDKYQQKCRKKSKIINIKIAQKIEQGLGRAVRGEKDYCVIILLGADLIKFIRGKDTREFFSEQTQKQINIGLKIAELAKSEVNNEKPIEVVIDLVNQSLSRKPEWKEYYNQEMNKIQIANEKSDTFLKILELERQSDVKFLNGEYEDAIRIIQQINDSFIDDEQDKAWYIQEMARIEYFISKDKSNTLQIAAHIKNKNLLKPEHGMSFSKLKPQPHKRIENIIIWVKDHNTFEELRLKIDEILTNLSFGMDSEKFEEALNDIAGALGFVSERPDNEWGAGPDNLWGISDDEYLLFECKNQIKLTRVDIIKAESGQMNNSIVWFKKNYIGAKSKNIMITPAKSLGKGAGFSEEVELMREKNLRNLKKNIFNFFNEFISMDFKSLSTTKINELLTLHKLTVENIKNDYSVKVK